MAVGILGNKAPACRSFARTAVTVRAQDMLTVQGDFGNSQRMPHAFKAHIIDRLNENLIAVFKA